MLKVFILSVVCFLMPVGAEWRSGRAMAETAVSGVEVQRLLGSLRMAETFAVMVEEGKAYGASIEEQMFPGQGGARWSARVDAIYDAATLQAIFDKAFAEALAADQETLAAANAFFGSELGQEILQLEIAGRRALLDEAVEEAARVEAERMQSERSPRMALVRDLVDAGDLIEMNVAGALSANLAFLQGMGAVGGEGAVMDQEQLMTEVWAQEESVRDETKKWLYPYLALAYQPLAEADLEAYIEFSRSPAGQRMNAALFLAFDTVFRQVSFELGRAAALHLQGNDI
jgi:Uncharacterized protein conserved in bacteria (DUF2059)